jgi:hypothetical protein
VSTAFPTTNRDVLVVTTILIAKDVLDAEVLPGFLFDCDKATDEIGEWLQLGGGWSKCVPPRLPVSFDPISSVNLFEEGVMIKGVAIRFGRRGGLGHDALYNICEDVCVDGCTGSSWRKDKT